MKIKVTKDQPTLPLERTIGERSRMDWEQFFSRNDKRKPKRPRR